MKLDVLGNSIINEFKEEYDFLSNFYLREMIFRSVKFHSSEQAYMWCKTEIPEEKEAILKCATPGQVKRFASNPANVTLREEWESTWRTHEMYQVVRSKYEQHQDLLKRLLATKDALLIEGNYHHDNFWGDCYCGKKEKCKEPGQNKLGKIHMALRSDLTMAKY